MNLPLQNVVITECYFTSSHCENLLPCAWYSMPDSDPCLTSSEDSVSWYNVTPCATLTQYSTGTCVCLLLLILLLVCNQFLTFPRVCPGL